MNPYTYYNKVKDKIIRPIWHRRKEIDADEFPPVKNRILDVCCHALEWRDIQGYPRHMKDPCIIITLFNKWRWVWDLNFIPNVPRDKYEKIRSELTWEAVVRMAVYGNNENVGDLAKEYAPEENKIVHITITKNLRHARPRKAKS